MLTSVETFNPVIPVSPLVVTEGSSPFQIKDIKGLEPVTATVNTTKYGSIDGEFDTGATVGKRNIVLTVELKPVLPELTQSVLRQMLYTYFMPKSTVRLRFNSTHMPTVDITGTVESMDPSLFGKDNSYQISIICPSPYFIDIEETAVLGTTIATSDDSPVFINYAGTVPTGFRILVSATDLSPAHDGDIIMNLQSPLEDANFLVNAVVDNTHDLEVSTLIGDKYVHSVFPGTTSFENILGSRAVGSKWLQMLYGDNYFQVKSETPGQAWKVTYHNLFGGI